MKRQKTKTKQTKENKAQKKQTKHPLDIGETQLLEKDKL
jgi:hypothetical protein